MDKLLLGIIASDHPEDFKRSLVHKILGKFSGSLPLEQAQTIFNNSIQWILQDDAFLNEVGYYVFKAIGGRHEAVFSDMFTDSYVLSLQSSHGVVSERFVKFLCYAFDFLASSNNRPQSVFAVVRLNISQWMLDNQNIEFSAAVARLLTKYPVCCPPDETSLGFNTAVIQSFSSLKLPKSSHAEMQQCQENIATVGCFMHIVWSKQQHLLLNTLREIFRIISSTSKSDPSVALGSLVQYLPIAVDSITTLMSSLATTPDVTDENLIASLSRMIHWLAWPYSKGVHLWIIGFFKSLAATKKFSILINVTLDKVLKVFSLLSFKVLRDNSLAVLTHMLISFQHSPQAFHMVVERVPALVAVLKNEQTESSQATLSALAELMYTLIYQHSGFPELYEPVLDALQSLPRPSESEIRKWLSENAWSAQISSGKMSTSLTTKSATGKAGLLNLGNTCYMNSVIQALFMLDGFRKKLLSSDLDPQRQPMLKNLQIVFAFLQLTQRASYPPSNFFQVSRPPWFVVGAQQDCSEFLRYFLDRAGEEEKSEASSKSAFISENFCGQLLVTCQCLTCQNESSMNEEFSDLSLSFPSPTPDNTRASDAAELHNSASVQTLKGGDVNMNQSAQQNITEPEVRTVDSSTSTTNLPSTSSDPTTPSAFLQQTTTLQSLLDFFFEPELLQDSNRYHCEQCGGLQDAKRTVQIIKAPKYLILTLKRFSYDVKCQQRSKILSDVKYPLDVKLKMKDTNHGVPHEEGLSESLGSDSSGKCPEMKQEHQAMEVQEMSCEGGEGDRGPLAEDPSHCTEVVYSLCSVIVHSGSSSESGHYYCYARHNEECVPVQDSPDSTPPPSRWYLFNDSRVTLSCYESLSHLTSRFQKDTAYVLFYRNNNMTELQPQENNNRNLLVQEVRPDLLDAVNADNMKYLQEQEQEARSVSKKYKPYNPRDNDDDGDDDEGGGGRKGLPGFCGGTSSGFNTPANRFVF